MTPLRFREDTDDWDDDDRLLDALRDALAETPAPPAPDFTDEEWERIRGDYDFDDGALARPRVSVDVGDGARHRAAGDAGQARDRLRIGQVRVGPEGPSTILRIEGDAVKVREPHGVAIWDKRTVLTWPLARDGGRA